MQTQNRSKSDKRQTMSRMLAAAHQEFCNKAITIKRRATASWNWHRPWSIRLAGSFSEALNAVVSSRTPSLGYCLPPRLSSLPAGLPTLTPPQRSSALIVLPRKAWKPGANTVPISFWLASSRRMEKNRAALAPIDHRVLPSLAQVSLGALASLERSWSSHRYVIARNVGCAYNTCSTP